MRLKAGPAGGRTRLLALDCRPPLQVMRAHYLDPAMPEMAFVTVMSPTGGVLQGDRLTLQIEAADGAQLHLDTASATRIYRMLRAEARQDVQISVGPGALVEFVPDHFLPYAGSRFVQRGRHQVAETGSLVLGEVVAPGRQARGEELAYERFESLVEVSRPSTEESALEPLFRDWCRLEPGPELGRRGILGGFTALGSLLVVSRGLDVEVLTRAVEEVAEGRTELQAGCSELPGDAGVWLRVLARDSASATAVVRAGWRAARIALTGAPPPAPRRF